MTANIQRKSAQSTALWTPSHGMVTSSNLHTAALWGPAGSEERLGEVARNGLGHPCRWHDKIMMMIHMYIYIYIFKQDFLKTMEHCLFIIINFIFHILLFFLCRDLNGKQIVLYLLPRRFRSYFRSLSGFVLWESFMLNFGYLGFRYILV